MKPLVLCAALPLLVGSDGSPAATDAFPHLPAPTITEWKVPWEKTRPRDPYVDGRGRVWFVGQAGNYVAYLDPASGKFTRFTIPDGAHPHNLIVDGDGIVWYAGNRNGTIGRLDPKDGSVKSIPMPDASVKDPHTLVFDQNDDIWFTAQGSNAVGKLTTATGQVRIVKLGTPNARPYGIVIDARNHPWFNQFGTNKIGTIDPATMQVREYTLPHERARGRRIAITKDQAVWYVDYTRGYLGRLDPATGKVEEWAAPGGAQSLPYAMTVDDRDRLWFVETGLQPNRLVSFDPRTRQFSAPTPIAESGGLTVRHMIYHAPTRSLWFGTDAGTIARAVVD
ncbi:MAG TPA: hypothetical protein VFY16_13080 [Gemmatimonadaceae bacterium]|nr:hypothetical protein [Gemmatimonadaceae bacterium]